MKIYLSCGTATLFLCLAASAQRTQPVNSGQLINEGVKLHDQGKYREAIEIYRQVPRNDTNYVLALHELALSQSADSASKPDAVATCRKALKADNGYYEHDLLILLASTIDDLGDKDHAIKLYDSALAKYPNSQGLLLNKGITLLRLDKYDQAEAIFQDLLIRNPYYSSAHFRLGQCALLKGQMVQALMCFYTYMLNSPTGSQSKSIIKMLDNISKAKDDVMEVVNKRTQTPEGNFAQVEQIILSKIALDKSYKVQTDLDDPIFRQLQVMMEKLEYDAGNPDFYMQFYVPYLKNIFTKKMFEPATMHAFSDINIDAIQRYVKKNSKDIDQALAVIAENFNLIRNTRELDFTKRQSADILYHFSNGALVAKGKMNKDQLTGRWEFYHKNGNIKTFGDYDANGKKTGKWLYYFECGKPSGSDEWKDGLRDGEDLTYNRQGVLTEKGYFVKGKQNNEKRGYFYPGHLHFSSTYKDDVESGKYIEYYTSGQLKIDAATADNSLQGPYIKYHENGKREIESNYEKGKLSGNYKSYYDNGQLNFEANYVNGEINGEAKTYHENSKLKRKCTYVNGNIEGEDLQYNDEGVLTQKVIYKKGKAEGLAEYYDDDSKLYSTFLFDNDKLKQAKYFDKTGKEISTSTRQSKMIDLNYYNPEGFKVHRVLYNDKAEVMDRETYWYNSGSVKETDDYKDGVLDGLAISYYPNGAKKAEVNYKGGERNGAVKNYFLDGKVSSEGWYVNGKVNGDWIEYNEKGNIVAITTYLDDDVYGTKQSFYPNGRLMDEEVYKEGWLVGVNQFDSVGNPLFAMQLPNGNGKYEGVHFNGKKKYEGQYVNGNVDGVFKSYFFDGSLSVSKKYQNGKLTGDYVDYYYGGKVYSQGKYEFGDRTGPWKFFTEEGKPLRDENYKRGELDGKIVYYYPNGKIEREINYKEGIRDGVFKRYSDDGQLASVMNYKDDVVVSYSYNGKDNQLVPFIPVIGGNGKVKTYFANGNVSTEMEFIEGKLNGPYKLYFPNGKIYYEEENMIDGLTQGKLVQYYANGKKESEYNYYYNDAEGGYKDYYEDGKVKEEGTYYNGYIHGTVKYYDPAGKLTQKKEYYYGNLLNVTK